MLQGYSGSLFYWDVNVHSFQPKSGMYVNHLSHTSLDAILSHFMYAATCLQLIEILVNRVEKSKGSPPPTLRAFVSSVSSWLKVHWHSIYWVKFGIFVVVIVDHLRAFFCLDRGGVILHSRRK